ncbi:MAG: 4Fe-4S dicluster domain-containing protein [Lachnospiraceae bacterium]|nr:4Fe-4S dicluster domain-containing protein [Lachnospiraceae bacterium]
MGRLGFYFDLTRCTGCKTCQIACKDKNRLDIGTIFRNVRDFETGRYPDVDCYHYSSSCNHCETPACLTICPTGAIYKADDGAVIIDAELCDGCGKCAEICPYEVPKILPEGIAGKCDSCKVRRDKGENPLCVDACQTRCLKFGDLDELEAEYGPDLVNTLPFLPDPAMTNPSILIKIKDSAKDENYREKYM